MFPSPPAEPQLGEDGAPQPDTAGVVVAALAGELLALLVVVGEAVPAAPRHRDLQPNLQDEEIRRSSLFINFLFV